jgi:pantoate--beta-alanine ligase
VLAAEAGADFLFAPPVGEVYPDGFATTVSVAGLTDVLEGAHRGRAHFDGVTTVVTKLFNMVAPDVAYFGQKDAQQALVIRRLIRDLDLPVRIEVCPIVREPDGLAMSSRNVRLTPEEREQALSLHRALELAQSRLDAGERDVAAITEAAREVLDSSGVDTEYFEIVSPGTLAPVTDFNGPALALVAAFVGSTRLIDNQPLSTAHVLAAGSTTTGAH